MNRFPSRPSRSARRNAEIWTERLAGSTNTFGQTRAINSCLVTNSPGRSSRTLSICMARLPRGTCLSPSSRRNCAGSKRNCPNEISRVVAPAGLPALSWLVSGLRRGRLTSELESEFNPSNNGASAIGKCSEAAADPDKAIDISALHVILPDVRRRRRLLRRPCSFHLVRPLTWCRKWRLSSPRLLLF